MATNVSHYLFDDREFQKDNDEAPFTVVSYRKSRPAGIPLTFKPHDPGSSFWGVIRSRIAQEVVVTAQEK